MTGVKPNTALGERLGVKIGQLGGITVNQQMQTSLDDVYAVGDCVEMADAITGKPILMPVGSTAARAGRQAGVVAVGGKKIYTDTSLRLQYDRIFNTDIICVGHSSTIASSLGVKAAVHYSDDANEFSKIALVTNTNGQLIGGQVLASRMGARVGYQIYQRVLNGSVLEEQPLLKFSHDRIKELMESLFGPIR
jgi:NADPH-dependent 2,4-dienoyl-CoA reductase/sulfur reductase-like enzyme